ncbi:MAG: GNAT family N-acetyltransferase [Saprospiraceae bacterium]|nr:GNAT family N-acetyltransferase [Saprospiraceae bacterium]MBP9209236.1 GNAT family N-acetyltransferase [Saprospiraceae bacterium]MBV6473013.1 hypothetical protein [Saprospiraceae bacterium]
MRIHAPFLTLRKAVPGDAEQLLMLVKELAEYEKEPGAVRTQADDFREGLVNGLFEALVLESPADGIVGMALYFPYFSTWSGKALYLEDFIIREPLRGHGYGQRLFEAVADEALRQGARWVKWQVLDWNEPARRFYLSRGAKLTTGWENGSIEICVADAPVD